MNAVHAPAKVIVSPEVSLFAEFGRDGRPPTASEGEALLRQREAVQHHFQTALASRVGMERVYGLRDLRHFLRGCAQYVQTHDSAAFTEFVQRLCETLEQRGLAGLELLGWFRASKPRANEFAHQVHFKEALANVDELKAGRQSDLKAIVHLCQLLANDQQAFSSAERASAVYIAGLSVPFLPYPKLAALYSSVRTIADVLQCGVGVNDNDFTKTALGLSRFCVRLEGDAQNECGARVLAIADKILQIDDNEISARSLVLLADSLSIALPVFDESRASVAARKILTIGHRLATRVDANGYDLAHAVHGLHQATKYFSSDSKGEVALGILLLATQFTLRECAGGVPTVFVCAALRDSLLLLDDNLRTNAAKLIAVNGLRFRGIFDAPTEHIGFLCSVVKDSLTFLEGSSRSRAARVIGALAHLLSFKAKVDSQTASKVCQALKIAMFYLVDDERTRAAELTISFAKIVSDSSPGPKEVAIGCSAGTHALRYLDERQQTDGAAIVIALAEKLVSKEEAQPHHCSAVLSATNEVQKYLENH